MSSQGVSPCLGWGLGSQKCDLAQGHLLMTAESRGSSLQGPVCFLIHHRPENNHCLGQSGRRGSKAMGLPSLRSRAFWRTQPRDLHPLSMALQDPEVSRCPDLHMTPPPRVSFPMARPPNGKVMFSWPEDCSLMITNTGMAF